MLLIIITFNFLFNIVNCTVNYLPEFERIVNGTDASNGEFPYMVTVRSDDSLKCGGTILNVYNILTAAHCAEHEKLSIQYGIRVLDESYHNVIKVKKVIIHKNYSPFSNYANDIAILQLTNPMKFNKLAQPVKLPLQNHEILRKTPGILIGWGLQKTGGEIQTTLKKVNIFAYTNIECERAHGSTVNTLIQMCAGVPEGGKGQCGGDSGGPLIVHGYQIGIVSWSVKPCAIKGYPGVLTKVSHFIEWIQAKIRI